jgi:hypothetical protein
MVGVAKRVAVRCATYLSRNSNSLCSLNIRSVTSFPTVFRQHVTATVLVQDFACVGRWRPMACPFVCSAVWWKWNEGGHVVVLLVASTSISVYGS